MSALRKIKTWLTGQTPSPSPQEVVATPPLWAFFESEGRRYEQFGVSRFSMEEMWRLYIRSSIRASQGVESVLSAIQDIYEPREAQAKEWRRLDYLKTKLKQHAQRFPIETHP